MSSKQGVMIRPLALQDTPQLINYLSRDPIANIYPLGWLTAQGIAPSKSNVSFQFIGAFNALKMTGLMLLAGRSLLFITTEEPQITHDFSQYIATQALQFKVLIGQEKTIKTTCEALTKLSIKPRLSRPQLLLVLRQKGFKPVSSSGLRHASLHDLEPLLSATLDMYSQEIMDQPSAADIPAFRRTLQNQIFLGNVYCCQAESSNQIAFKANVTAQCKYGTQVEGVYVPPHLRRRGFATMGMSQLCLQLLESSPLVSLFVNRDNRPARSLYEQKLGFQPTHDFITAFF